MEPTSPTLEASRASQISTKRYYFSLVTCFFTVVLMSWGAVVTSINAGLAVPDWPSSFDSYDPFAPIEGWTRIPAVLAEHGHRLMGALVGMLTLVLTIWTLVADRRRWMKQLAIGALVLVIVQGVLGGLRVVWTSLDLAVVHACVAQLFFAVVVGMAVFVSRMWQQATASASKQATLLTIRRSAVITAAVIYLQFILGALLRHYGMGMHIGYASVHVIGGMAVLVAILMTSAAIRMKAWDDLPLKRSAQALITALVAQLTLGFLAFAVIMNEKGVPESLWQVWLNSAHLVVGALVMASTVSIIAFTIRLERDDT